MRYRPKEEDTRSKKMDDFDWLFDPEYEPEPRPILTFLISAVRFPCIHTKKGAPPAKRQQMARLRTSTCIHNHWSFVHFPNVFPTPSPKEHHVCYIHRADAHMGTVCPVGALEQTIRYFCAKVPNNILNRTPANCNGHTAGASYYLASEIHEVGTGEPLGRLVCASHVLHHVGVNGQLDGVSHCRAPAAARRYHPYAHGEGHMRTVAAYSRRTADHKRRAMSPTPTSMWSAHVLLGKTPWS